MADKLYLVVAERAGEGETVTTSEPTSVNAIGTTFRILEVLKDHDGCGVAEIADHLGMPKSTVHDHLQSLHTLGYVVKDDGIYRVGARFLDLGGYARQRMKTYQVARPEIKKLAEETGEHANLMVEQHGQGIFLDKTEGEDAVQLDTYAGMQVHLHTTALGKAMLAHMPDERVDEIVDRHGLPAVTENTISDPEELREQLREVRKQGYAVDDEERVEGMRCIAAPIVGPDDDPAGAVSISGPTIRMQGEQFEEDLPEAVLGTANVIAVNLTYS